MIVYVLGHKRGEAGKRARSLPDRQRARLDLGGAAPRDRCVDRLRARLFFFEAVAADHRVALWPTRLLPSLLTENRRD